ncbi:MAG: hypothetical protein ACRDQ0_18205 [Pseudonocardia sp.]
MSSRDALGATREAIAALTEAVSRLREEYGDTLGVRRVTSDLERFSADLDELGGPARGHRPGVKPEDLEEIPDEPYDESMWADAETEGQHAP